jgi:hypothetical protein
MEILEKFGLTVAAEVGKVVGNHLKLVHSAIVEIKEDIVGIKEDVRSISNRVDRLENHVGLKVVPQIPLLPVDELIPVSQFCKENGLRSLTAVESKKVKKAAIESSIAFEVRQPKVAPWPYTVYPRRFLHEVVNDIIGDRE